MTQSSVIIEYYVPNIIARAVLSCDRQRRRFVYHTHVSKRTVTLGWLQGHKAVGNFQLRYGLVGPASYLRPVFEQNIVMGHMAVSQYCSSQ